MENSFMFEQSKRSVNVVSVDHSTIAPKFLSGHYSFFSPKYVKYEKRPKQRLCLVLTLVH